jgi:LuxR family maltose regulon positive regulatory protein
MDELLLKTKLTPPPLRRELVARPRLMDLLNEDLWYGDNFARKLTLVSAPAGYGKTTLVAEWLRSQEHAVTWLSLDENDDDPARFMGYLMAALAQVDPQFGGTLRTMLGTPQPPPQDIIATALVNEIGEISTPFSLVLDDFQFLQNPTIHQQLNFILDYQPENMHLVITTREDPPVPLSRLRASKQVLEVRQTDLSFTLEEVSRFLQSVVGISLSQDDAAALDRNFCLKHPSLNGCLRPFARRLRNVRTARKCCAGSKAQTCFCSRWMNPIPGSATTGYLPTCCATVCEWMGTCL